MTDCESCTEVVLVHNIIIDKSAKIKTSFLEFAFTVFIRLSAQGAYLIFGLSGWALIRSWALIKFSPFSFYLIYTFLRAYDDNEVSVKVTGSKTLKNGLVVPGTLKTRTPNRAIATKFVIFFWGGGGGRLFKVGSLKSTFPRWGGGVGAYSRLGAY